MSDEEIITRMSQLSEEMYHLLQDLKVSDIYQTTLEAENKKLLEENRQLKIDLVAEEVKSSYLCAQAMHLVDPSDPADNELMKENACIHSESTKLYDAARELARIWLDQNLDLNAIEIWRTLQEGMICPKCGNMYPADAYEHFHTCVGDQIKEQGETESEEGKTNTRIVEVRGNGTDIAYTRIVQLQTVTFQCAICHNTATKEQYPGPAPKCCSDECEKEYNRMQTRERVARFRASHSPKQKARVGA